KRALIAKGACISCGQSPARPKRNMCQSCATKKAKRAFSYYNRCRRLALQHYGGTCTCCGEQDEAFLVFDHMKGGGSAHRRRDRTAIQIGSWLIRNGFPCEFQILCHNCNFAKHTRGQCPHEEV
ncbi:hypothetical protein LCGC14_2298970, partial [marine sediment metagenome]